jgi:hypothetical protein
MPPRAVKDQLTRAAAVQVAASATATSTRCFPCTGG